jgi:hypothetical protein
LRSEPRRGTGSATVLLWWRWRGSIDPTATTNLTTAFSFVDTSGAEHPIRPADSQRYQQAYITSGMSDTFPLDSQNLQIRFDNGTDDESKLEFGIDRDHISRDPRISVPGRNTSGVSYATQQLYPRTLLTDPVVLMDALSAVALIAVVITFARTVWRSAKVREIDDGPRLAESLRRTDHRLAVRLGIGAPHGMLLASLLDR